MLSKCVYTHSLVSTSYSLTTTTTTTTTTTMSFFNNFCWNYWERKKLFNLPEAYSRIFEIVYTLFLKFYTLNSHYIRFMVCGLLFFVWSGGLNKRITICYKF